MLHVNGQASQTAFLSPGLVKEVLLLFENAGQVRLGKYMLNNTKLLDENFHSGSQIFHKIAVAF